MKLILKILLMRLLMLAFARAVDHDPGAGQPPTAPASFNFNAHRWTLPSSYRPASAVPAPCQVAAQPQQDASSYQVPVSLPRRSPSPAPPGPYRRQVKSPSRGSSGKDAPADAPLFSSLFLARTRPAPIHYDDPELNARERLLDSVRDRWDELGYLYVRELAIELLKDELHIRSYVGLLDLYLSKADPSMEQLKRAFFLKSDRIKGGYYVRTIVAPLKVEEHVDRYLANHFARWQSKKNKLSSRPGRRSIYAGRTEGVVFKRAAEDFRTSRTKVSGLISLYYRATVKETRSAKMRKAFELLQHQVFCVGTMRQLNNKERVQTTEALLIHFVGGLNIQQGGGSIQRRPNAILKTGFLSPGTEKDVAARVAFCGSAPPGKRGFVPSGCGEAALQDWLRHVARLAGTPYNADHLPLFSDVWDNKWSNEEYLDYESRTVANGQVTSFPPISKNAARHIDRALAKLDGLVCVGRSTFCATIAYMRKLGVTGIPDLLEVPAAECAGLTFDLIHDNRPFVIALAPHWGQTFNYGGTVECQSCDLLLAAAAVSGTHSAIARLYPNPRRAFPEGPEGPALFPVGPLPDIARAEAIRKLREKEAREPETDDDYHHMTSDTSSEASSDEWVGLVSASGKDDEEIISMSGDNGEDSDVDFGGKYGSLDGNQEDEEDELEELELEGEEEEDELEDDQIEEVIEFHEVIEISDDEDDEDDMGAAKWDWSRMGDLDSKDNVKMEEDWMGVGSPDNKDEVKMADVDNEDEVKMEED